MKANVLVATIDMERHEWLKWREKGIGGSDAASIAGLNPWKSPVEVWLEKTDQSPEREDNESMYWGRVLEDIVADEFSKRTGKKVRRVNQILQNPDQEFMLANLDRKIVGENALLECKTTNEYSKNEWKEKVPDMYMIQVQHYLAVTKYTHAYMAVLVGGREFKYYKIDRDDELINYLIEIEKNFWNLVQSNIPPEVDGSKASAELLKKIYPEAKPESRITLPDNVKELVEQRETFKQREQEAKEMKTEAENKIKQIMGESEIGLIDGERVVSWKNIVSNRIDSKRLKKEKPEVYSKFLKPSASRRFEIHS